MNFTLKRREEAVEIDGRKLVLRELDGRARAAFMDEARAREKGELRAVNGSLEAFVISLALFDESGAKAGTPEVVDTWPATVVMALSDRACRLSGIGGESEAKGNG